MLYYLDKDVIWFPPIDEAADEGLLAYGGDLTPEWLLEAYANGIFPWFNSDSSEILWWSPNPRFILFPDELVLPRSLRQAMKKKIFTVSIDTAFEEVVLKCAKPRKTQSETWITGRMADAYSALHYLGYAHSVEVWCSNSLAGGLYGLSLGNAFFGESMFTQVNNASKIALAALIAVLRRMNYAFVDCQIYTPNLERFGARYIARKEFAVLLEGALKHETLKCRWNNVIAGGYDYLECLNGAEV